MSSIGLGYSDELSTVRKIMTKRTSPEDIQDWDDVPDINHIVNDKRAVKRATPAKGRRRNRRYENRLLNAQLDSHLTLEEGRED